MIGERMEPGKALAMAFGAGVGITFGLFALATWIIFHVIAR
jgi:hypothetical protein